jgi:hypothetical protein
MILIMKINGGIHGLEEEKLVKFFPFPADNHFLERKWASGSIGPQGN